MTHHEGGLRRQSGGLLGGSPAKTAYWTERERVCEDRESTRTIRDKSSDSLLAALSRSVGASRPLRGSRRDPTREKSHARTLCAAAAGASGLLGRAHSGARTWERTPGLPCRRRSASVLRQGVHDGGPARYVDREGPGSPVVPSFLHGSHDGVALLVTPPPPPPPPSPPVDAAGGKKKKNELWGESLQGSSYRSEVL